MIILSYSYTVYSTVHKKLCGMDEIFHELHEDFSCHEQLVKSQTFYEVQ